MVKHKLLLLSIPVAVILSLLLLAACAGPAGEKGPAGLAGPIGPAGPVGPTGPAGTVPPATTTTPPAPVVVDAGAAQTAKPGDTVTLKAAVKINNASTVRSYKWTQIAGPKATLSGDTTDTLKATLADAKAVKAELFKGLRTENRFQVQAINPHALIGAETSTFEVAVTTSSGTYKKTVAVNSTIPYAITTGLANVPKGVPVLLSGKTQTSYNWALSGPTGTKATVTDATDRFPSFTPDVVGKYTVTEASSKAAIDVYAGTWAGAITGVDAKGRPLTGECSACHNGTIAPDNFKEWKETGHAEIFSQNLNDPAGHWAITCAECHTVGYAPGVDNGGFDEAVAAEKWQVPPHGDKGLWENVIVKQFPKTAKLANIQCENCHGPNNDSTLHINKTMDAARISIASEVCGACHGEPLRHGRYQQWEESSHAGTATTPARAIGNASCARCHSGQGFLAWLEQGDLTKQLQGKNGNATAAELAAMGLTADKVQPITCAVCHDPHDIGTVTGEPTEANRASSARVRVMEATKMLPAGFQAKDVGKGALCITCHNTRNAVHGDDIAITSYSAPHTAAQGDVLMGQNSFFVERGARSPHASIVDTCVTCHMESTPPPPEFSFQGGGTNHSFEASIKICGDCHTKLFNGAAFQSGITDKEHELAEAMGKYFLSKLPAQVTVKDYTPHTYQGASVDALSTNIVLSKDNIASAEPTEPHGQQGFIIKLKSPVSVSYSPATGQTWAAHTVSMNELEVRLGDITTDGTKVLIPVTDVLVKAGWNFFLIEGDGSKGVHNPAFAAEVLDATIEALK